jgi:hypothetical protein
LAEESARLARTIDRLRRDPEFIQDLIRRDLNFVKKNEIIIQLPGAEGVKASGEEHSAGPGRVSPKRAGRPGGPAIARKPITPPDRPTARPDRGC